MTVLDRKLITRMVNPQPGGNGGGGGSVPSSQAVNWTDIDGKPTTLAGYGITDAKWADQTQTSDRRNLTIGSVTQQVITAHQSLYGYATEYWVGQQGFATQSWVGQQGYLTSSALSGYATQTWVGQQGFATQTWVGQQGYATQTWVGNNYLPLAGGAMNSGARISFNGGNGYIGNADNAGWLLVQDICSQNGAGDTYWAIRTNGQAVFTKMTSKTSSKALSDARHKDVKRSVGLTVEQIAAMPAVIFEWLDKDLKDIDPGEHVGTLAQEWQKILPQAVSEQEDGTLTMGYGEAALVSVITLARRVLKLVRSMFKLTRHVLKLERRVLKLEKEIAKLKEQKECH